MLHFDEKGGKSREIPVRHNLERFIFDYLEAAGWIWSTRKHRQKLSLPHECLSEKAASKRSIRLLAAVAAVAAKPSC